jgi:hypothetical protein
LTTSFEPVVAAIADRKAGDPIQGYCDFLNHRIRLAQKRSQDVPNDEALEDWIISGMPGFDLNDGDGASVH